jgi:hypothetical protein
MQNENQPNPLLSDAEQEQANIDASTAQNLMLNNEIVDDEDEENTIPSQYLDPITQEIMKNPVMTVQGQTYERKSIEEWFKTCRENHAPITDPLTNEELDSDLLISNFSLKQMIEDHPRLKQECENNHKFFNKLALRKTFAAAVLDLIDSMDSLKNDPQATNAVTVLINRRAYFSWIDTTLTFINTRNNENPSLESKEENASLKDELKKYYPEIPNIAIQHIKNFIDNNPVLKSCDDDSGYLRSITEALFIENRLLIEDRAGIISEKPKQNMHKKKELDIQMTEEIHLESNNEPKSCWENLTGISPYLKR